MHDVSFELCARGCKDILLSPVMKAAFNNVTHDRWKSKALRLMTGRSDDVLYHIPTELVLELLAEQLCEPFSSCDNAFARPPYLNPESIGPKNDGLGCYQ